MAHLLPKLRCQFAEFLNQSSLTRLGILSLPTCVGLRYGRRTGSTRRFSWKLRINEFATPRRLPLALSSLRASVCVCRLLPAPTTGLNRVPFPGSPTFLRPCLLQRHALRCRNINLLAIDYAFRPRLRTRLTLGGRAWPRKPEVFGEEDSHLLYRYSCLHLHFCALHASLPVTLLRTQKAPLPIRTHRTNPVASVSNLAPVHLRRRLA